MNKFLRENNICAFVFDMDGILLDSESVYEKAWQVAAEEMHLEDIDSIHRKCLGLSEEGVFKILSAKYGDEFDGQKFWKQTSDWSLNYMKENGVPVKKGVFGLLDFLMSEKIPLAVATSSEESFAGKLLTKTKLIDYFETIIYGNEVVNSKPDPEIYSKACKKLGIAPEKSVAIEDSPNGIKSAKSAGLKCVMVPDRIPADEEMKKTVWKIFDSLLDFKNLIENN